MKKSKKTNLKRAIALAIAAVMCMALPGGAVIASSSPLAVGGSTVSPANIIISATDNSLELKALGVLECYGETQVPYGYDAYVKVELQQKDGSWSTIKTWTDEGGSSACVDQNYAVLSGYSYRLKLTHKAYDSDGNLIEKITEYSDTIAY